MQAPGGPEEDASGGFQYGGWSAPYNDDISGKMMLEQMKPADLLLGRKTYEIFAEYWPRHADVWPGINEVKKYVLSNTVRTSGWANTEFLTSVAEIEQLKQTAGADLKVWGSSQLVQLLLKHDLVDELWLKIYPLTLGTGKKLFGNEAIPAAFELIESRATPCGVIFASYRRTGAVVTGTIGD
jgi:dihydrofolate reductase